MKLKVKVNFDFGKLARAIPKLVKEHTSSYAVDSAKGSKEAIDKGLRPLGDVAKKMRKREGFPASPPLKKTGNLYKSIKQEGNKISMLGYGLLHNDGHTTHPDSAIPNVRIEPRPFITTTIKNRKKITDTFINSVKKALRK
jgi:phage gpG-like protein